MSVMSKLNIVFPIGKKPEIVFHESSVAEKDCYIYWDLDYLKIHPTWLPKEDIKHKEVYSINNMQKTIDKQKEEIEELKSISVYDGSKVELMSNRKATVIRT